MNAANRSSTSWKAEERRSSCAPSAMPADPPYEVLRRLAVEDPREARKVFLRCLDSGGPALEHFLGQISSPADGRLRHLIASVLRNNRDKERLAPYLIAWHEIETDEFAKRAIAAALDGVKAEMAQEVARLTTAIGREAAQRERLNRELEIAREVQEHLFPQHLPTVPGLEYSGQCRPAREVGLDYSSTARRQVWNCHRRCVRQGCWRRPHDGKPRSLAPRVGFGCGRSRGAHGTGERLAPSGNLGQPLSYLVLRVLRSAQPPFVLRQRRSQPTRGPAELRRRLSGISPGDR